MVNPIIFIIIQDQTSRFDSIGGSKKSAFVYIQSAMIPRSHFALRILIGGFPAPRLPSLGLRFISTESQYLSLFLFSSFWLSLIPGVQNTECHRLNLAMADSEKHTSESPALSGERRQLLAALMATDNLVGRLDRYRPLSYYSP